MHEPDKDIERQELKWNASEEGLIERWSDDCIQRSVGHGKKAKFMKKWYIGLGIPTTLIPILMSGLTTNVDVPGWVLTVGLITSGMLSGVSSFMNFGQKYAKHGEYEQRFAELHNSMNKELAKPMAFRTAADAYMESCLGAYNRTCSNSPDL